MDLSLLAGNAPLKHQLNRQTALRGLSHAYMISGSPGSGRRTLAGILAAALVCSAPEGISRPCLRCPGCRKAVSGIHPDVIRVGDDGKDISVAQVRALRADAYIRPNEAERKVYILENAQSMNSSAQNAMLKLLEEGPGYAAFLLITDNAAALLSTVRSRCESLSLSPVSLPEAEEYLLRRFPDKPVETVRAAAARCEGLLGRAAAELEGTDEGDKEAGKAAAELLRRLAAGDELSLMEFCASLEKWDRDALAALCGEGVLLLRGALARSVGVSGGEPDAARAAAEEAASRVMSRRALLSCAEVLERIRAACGCNVGPGHLSLWLCAALAPIALKSEVSL